MEKKSLLKKGIFLLCLSLLASEPIMALNTTSTVNTSCSPTFSSTKCHALELAGALMNHGFRVRDDAWMVTLTPKTPVFLQVTLFEGNQYWFIAAASTPARSLKLKLYDAFGTPLPLDSWKDNHTIPGGRAAAGMKAPHSGKYFVSLELMSAQGNVKVDTSLIYAYQ